jgi:hypothetical protein
VGDSKTSDEVLLRFDDSGTGRAVVLEDDGRVAYAYLLDREDVVSDVWLYNVSATPKVVNWDDLSQAPFLNPQQFCKPETAPRLDKHSTIECVWSDDGVEVTINGTMMARLEAGTKPGWSRLASCPGPLARPLNSKMSARSAGG